MKGLINLDYDVENSKQGDYSKYNHIN